MISRHEFLVLDLLVKNGDCDLPVSRSMVKRLLNEKYVEAIYLNGNSTSKKLRITTLGKRAHEEYNQNLMRIDRENHSISIAEEANDIAKEANRISISANKKSHVANVLALIAIIVPSLISVGALVVSILAYFKN